MRTMTVRPGALLLAVLFSVGCLTADGTLEPGGGAQVTVDYPALGDEKSTRALVTAPDVAIESLELRAAGAESFGTRRAVAKLSTKDVHKLGALPLLKSVGATVVHEPKDGGGVLRIAVRSPSPKPAGHPEVAKYEKHEVRVGLALPGPIVETTATQEADRVVWTFSAKEWALGKLFELSVTYGPKAAEGASDEKSRDPEAAGDES